MVVPAINLALVRRLGELPEARILDYFWLMMGEGAEPLDVLVNLAEVRVHRPAEWDARQIRLEHEQRRHALPVLPLRRCFVCVAADRRLYFHHIVEVQHGGSNTIRNFVTLCFRCHKFLHPWLTTEPPIRPSGFESIRSIMPRAVEELLPESRESAS